MLCQSLRKHLPVRSNERRSFWIAIALMVASSSFLIFYFVRSVYGETSPVVKLSRGNLIGFTQNILGNPIYTYLNVPYARPANEHRFDLSQPDDSPWHGDRLATSYGPSCPIPEPQTGVQYSEDCLQLNVWTPVLFNKTNPFSSLQLRPVFVFIHGGALLFGSANEEKYFDAAVLASQGDLVVVNFNYRLGILGFLYNGNEIEGNLGFWDQRLALLWVHENIEKFGGDPNQITLAGESAGSWSVGVHLLLEEESTRPVFHRAMMMSGAPLQPVLEEPEAVALKKYALVLERTGCTDFECLKKVRLENLMELNSDQEIINLSRNIFRLAFQPVYGPKNLLLSKSTFKKLTDNEYRVRNVSLLIGNLVNEGQDAWTLWKSSFNNAPVEPTGSKESYIKALQHFVETTVDLPATDLRALVANMDKFYFSPKVLAQSFDSPLEQSPEQSLEQSLRSSFYRALSDLVFICPSKFFAKSYFNKMATVYEYQITYASMSAGTKDFDPHCEEDKFGPCHCLDLQYLFGRPLKHTSDYSENDRALSFDMIHLVAHFARTGEVDWRPYFKMNVGRAYQMIVPTKLELNPTTGNKEHTGMEQLSCTMLEKYFYAKKLSWP